MTFLYTSFFYPKLYFLSLRRMNEMISIKLQDLIEKRQRDEDFKTWLSGWYEDFTQLKQSLEELDETREMLKSCSFAFGKLLALEGFQNLTI